MRHLLSFWEPIIQTFFLFGRNFPIRSTSRDKCQSFSKESVGCRAWHQTSWNPEPGSADWIFHPRTSSTWLQAGGWLDQFRRIIHSSRSDGTSRGILSSSFLCLISALPSPPGLLGSQNLFHAPLLITQVIWSSWGSLSTSTVQKHSVTFSH